MKFINTIKSKFIFILIIFVIISVGAPVYFLVLQFEKNFRERSERMLESTIDMLNFGLNNAMMLGESKNVNNIVDELVQNENVEHIRIIKPGGLIVHSSIPNEIGKVIDEVAPEHFIHYNSTDQSRSIVLLKSAKVYAAFQPLINKPYCQGCHTEENVISILDVDTKLTQAEINFFTGSFHIIFLGAAVIILLVVGLIYFFNLFINRPVLNFIAALDDVEKGDLNVKLPERKDDEFGKLNAHFNRMVSELKSSREKIDQMHYDQLRHADQLATVGELTAQMAHEINNYTAIMMSRADYLIMEAENDPALSSTKEDLLVIQKEINKIADITQNILRHSKKRQRQIVDFDLLKVVDQSTRIFTQILEKKNIYLTKNYSTDSIMMSGDPTEIEQIFINIINNSADSIKDTGEIKISIMEENESAVVEIEDNGSGMTDETKANIFSPFFTTKEENRGTGLGLFIVKKICDNNGIFMHCSSKVNTGTKFQFVFPNIKEMR